MRLYDIKDPSVELPATVACSEYWQDTAEKTVEYLELNGHITARYTNYLSTTTVEVTSGHGSVVTDSLFEFNQGARIVVPRGVPYRLAGSMSCLITSSPGIRQETVAIGDQKISRQGRRLVARIERQERMDIVIEELVKQTSRLLEYYTWVGDSINSR